jgi:DNA-binding YbaB/EbfC family protein
MANIMKLMKQAAAMQKEMERVQQGLASKTVEFSSGGGMVVATATCDGALTRLKIDPKVADPAAVDLLEDMVVAAVDGALKKGKEQAATEMQKVTAGLQLPGIPGLTA